MSDDYIYVKMKIPVRNYNVNFCGDGAGLLHFLKEGFTNDNRHNYSDIRQRTIEQIQEYMNQMRYKQHYFFIASDEGVEIVQHLTEAEFLSKEDFGLNNDG